jgi:hypothetical protein
MSKHGRDGRCGVRQKRPPRFATVTVRGTFATFAGSKPVFQGRVKSAFSRAQSCNGQESFQATAGG